MENTKNKAEFCKHTIIHDDIVNYVKEKMLAEGDFAKLSLFFKSIADETRIKILFSLLQSEMCVCDIATLLEMTVSAISHQLRVLKQAELVRYEKRGKVVYYSLNDDHVQILLGNAIEHLKE